MSTIELLNDLQNRRRLWVCLSCGTVLLSEQIDDSRGGYECPYCGYEAIPIAPYSTRIHNGIPNYFDNLIEDDPLWVKAANVSLTRQLTRHKTDLKRLSDYMLDRYFGDTGRGKNDT